MTLTASSYRRAVKEKFRDRDENTYEIPSVARLKFEKFARQLCQF
jgi:hypothetical protein